MKMIFTALILFGATSVVAFAWQKETPNGINKRHSSMNGTVQVECNGSLYTLPVQQVIHVNGSKYWLESTLDRGVFLLVVDDMYFAAQKCYK